MGNSSICCQDNDGFNVTDVDIFFPNKLPTKVKSDNN